MRGTVMQAVCFWKRALALMVFVSFLTGSAGAAEEVLNGPEYYARLMECVKGAKTCIEAALYTTSLREDNPRSQTKALLEALIEAKKRGVKVSLVVDFRGEASWKYGDKSYAAYYFLKERGIEAELDEAGTPLHAKVVVVDGAACLVGSSNWSDYAFTINDELNIYSDIPASVAKASAWIRGIKRRGGGQKGEGYAVSGAWVAKDGALVKLYSAQSARAFDLMLVLACHPQIDYAGAGERLGIQAENNSALRRAVNRELKKIAKTGAMEVSFSFGKNFRVSIPADNRDKILLPKEYELYGWDRRLSLSAKMALLIFLKEAEGKFQIQDWISNWEEKYGVKGSLDNGRTELREWGILTMEYAPLEKGRHSGPTTIILNGLYDYDARMEELESLKAELGEERFEKAHKRAGILFLGNSPEKIREIDGLAQKYSEKALEYAFKIAGGYEIQSHYRSMKYVVGILQNPKRNWEG